MTTGETWTAILIGSAITAVALEVAPEVGGIFLLLLVAAMIASSKAGV